MPRRDSGFPDGFIGPDMVDAMLAYTQGRWRKEIESRPLRTNTTLQAALKKQPAMWVEGICRELDLPKMRRVKERVEALCDRLPREETLAQAWKKLPEPPRRMLHWLLSHEGSYTTIQKLSAKFGRDEDITWWWNEGQTPVTPLGLLRLFGLVFVGRARMGKRNVRVAVEPEHAPEA